MSRAPRPSVRVSFYRSLCGQRSCKKEEGLLGLVACVKHYGPRAGLALRIDFTLPDGPPVRSWHYRNEYLLQPLGCYECVERHEALVVEAVRRVFPEMPRVRRRRLYNPSLYVHLFEGAGTKRLVRRAQDAWRAAIRASQMLGYDVEADLEEGGVGVFRALRPWRKVGGCKKHISRARLSKKA